jgi:hypothetical protein
MVVLPLYVIPGCAFSGAGLDVRLHIKAGSLWLAPRNDGVMA